MAKYVVCMDSRYVRDSQRFDMTGLSNKEFRQIDMSDEENDDLWVGVELNLFVDVINAKNESEACGIVAKQYEYDKRCLYAFKA